MSRLRRAAWALAQTLLRLLPFPAPTGLVSVGSPGRDAPVLLTGNFRLTVERVKRAMAGLDAWLLVANSRGVNVWCAATGGLLTDHDVISVLRTSGIEARVDHRQVVLPQLAATGIDGHHVHRATGWHVVWGPVEASHIPAFLRSGMRCSRAERMVGFPWTRRLEMAVAWAFPLSLLVLPVWPFWRAAVLPLAAMVWALSLLVFLAFPLYAPRLRADEPRHGIVFFDFGRYGLPLLLWFFLLLGVSAFALSSGRPLWPFLVRWGLAGVPVVLALSIDLMGSTPLYKSGLHAERRLRIALDPDRCKGAGFCEQVCPVEVFVVDRARKLATLPGFQRCVQCGACIVQCPFDALSLRGDAGEAVDPETIRRFKLNLLGKRRGGASTARPHRGAGAGPSSG